MRYVTHEIGDILEHNFFLMSLKRNLAKEVYQAYGEIQVLHMSVRDDIKKEANELQNIEAIFQVLGEKLHYFYLMFFNVG